MFYFVLDLVIFGASQLNALLQRPGSRDERKAADWFGGCVSPTALSGKGRTEHSGGTRRGDDKGGCSSRFAPSFRELAQAGAVGQSQGQQAISASSSRSCARRRVRSFARRTAAAATRSNPSSTAQPFDFFRLELPPSLTLSLFLSSLKLSTVPGPALHFRVSNHPPKVLGLFRIFVLFFLFRLDMEF